MTAAVGLEKHDKDAISLQSPLGMIYHDLCVHFIDSSHMEGAKQDDLSFFQLIRELKSREGKTFAQGHTAISKQSLWLRVME